MAGLLLELRRQLAGNRRRNAYKSHEARPPAGRAAPKEPQHRPHGQYGPPEPQGQHGPETLGEDTDRPHGSTCERTQDIVNRDDFLLQQIDEFRDRARELQELMNCREEQVRKLEEARISEQERLKQEAGRYAQPAAARDYMPFGPQAQVRGVGFQEEQMQRLEKMLDAQGEQTQELTTEVERKIDEMIASVGARLSELDESVRESVSGGQGISEQRAGELKESLVQLREQLERLKADLSDKVHTENVKCYRNIQDLLKNMEKKLDSLSALEYKVSSARAFAIAAMVFAALDFAAVFVSLLVQFGVFAG